MLSVFLLSLQIIGQASVIDGDTIEIHGKKIRLFGIDAPEAGQICRNQYGKKYRCGQQASFALQQRIQNKNLRCALVGRDSYNRMLGRCFLKKNGLDLNRYMVRSGHALAYRRYTHLYHREEIYARKQKKGLWQGPFKHPEKWRRENPYKKNEK